ncbi:MAG TPA: carbonic anhydrase [Verrucomicrobiae bacterium]|nr:carbonic anhydrase [Verrucomicrobiae bacterium]
MHPADFADELPIVALTCIDPRLNSILPQVLGVPPDQFIWLRNAGNIITGPLSSTMRSVALACAVKGAREIAIIGHTDCLVGKTSIMQLIDKLQALGVERHLLPDNISEYFGMFSNERQNVMKATEIARSSPLLGPRFPVHGLIVDVESGKLEWLVNGYETLSTVAARWNEVVKSAGRTVDALKPLSDFNIGEMKFPETKIGEVITNTENWLSDQIHDMEAASSQPPAPPAPPQATPPLPPKIPLPPPMRPKIFLRRGSR